MFPQQLSVNLKELLAITNHSMSFLIGQPVALTLMIACIKSDGTFDREISANV